MVTYEMLIQSRRLAETIDALGSQHSYEAQILLRAMIEIWVNLRWIRIREPQRRANRFLRFEILDGLRLLQNEPPRVLRRLVRIEEREDGSLSFWYGEHALLATAFPKEHGVQQGEVVENKRLSATIEFIKARQRERTEAKVAKASTTLRKARLLRAGTPRWTRSGSPA